MKPMKIAALLLLGLLTLPALTADEKTAVWERIYKNSFSDEQRFAVMLNIRELKDKSFGPLLNDSLLDLLTRQIEKGTLNEINAKRDLTKLLVQELGDLRNLEAAPQVFKTYDEVQDPILKGEAVLSLGKMRAVEFAPDLARQLTIFNFQPKPDEARKNEIIAYSLVQALEIMRSPEGFEPVFFASIGWYSGKSQVKEIARKALKNIVDDPTDSLVKILKSSTDLVMKLRALEAADESKASVDNKAKVALAALDDGVTVKPKDTVQSTQLADLRKKAIQMLIVGQNKAPEAVANLVAAIKLNYDDNEFVSIYKALGINASKPAVDYLIAQIKFYNTRQQSQVNTTTDERRIKSIVQALALTKNPEAKSVLLEMKYANYTPGMIREFVDPALKAIPAN